MQINSRGYKQTEIGEVPKEWEITTLGQIANISSSKRIFASEYQNSGVPFYRGREIIEKHDGKSVTNKLFISEEKYHEIQEKFGVPQENDILLTSVGTLGIPYKVNKHDRFYFKDGNITWFRRIAEVTSEYLYCWLNSSWGKRKLIEKSIGSTQQALTIEALKSVVLALPPEQERQRISSVVCSIDHKIELNRKMNQTLEEIGRALFRQWFVDSEALGAKVELEDFIELNPRESLKKGEIARHVEMKDLPEQGMWVSSQVSKPYKGGSKFRNSDSLMARITPCLENGKSALVNFLEDGELAFGSTEYIVFRPKEKHYREYVYCLVRDEKFRRHAIKSMVGSSGRQRVQIDAIRTYKLKQSSDESVGKFHDLLKPIFQRIKINSLENESLSALRNSLLPRLMSGRLRIEEYDNKKN